MRKGRGLSASRRRRSHLQPAWRGQRERAGASDHGARLPRRAQRHGQRRCRRHPGARRRQRLRGRHDPERGRLHRGQPRPVPRGHLPRPPANALNASQESALQAFIQGGRGFVGIGGAAEAQPGSTFFNGLIGARPTAGSPTATAEKVVEVGDRVHPANEGLPLEWTRSDVWYEWTTRPTGQVHTVARYRAPERPRRRRHRHRRHRLADLLVPRLPGRPLLLHRHGPDRRRLRRGEPPHPPARRHPVERRHDPRRLQGDDRLQLPGHAPGRRIEPRHGAHGRVARRRARPQRLGLLHRPRRLPHQRAARPDDRHRARRRASSTSRTATSASAAATSTSGIPTPPTAPSTAASRSRGSCPSTATAAAEPRSTARSRPACSASRCRRTSCRPGTSTSSTSRPSTRTTRSTPASPTATSGGSRR